MSCTTPATSFDDLVWWRTLAPSLKWRETFPGHAYLVRGSTLAAPEFDRAVRVIRTFGQPASQHGQVRIELTSGLTCWWTSGAPLGETMIITQGRVREDPAGGRHEVPDTASPYFSVYNTIATGYDEMFVDPVDLDNNRYVRNLIHEFFGSRTPRTLDVGCGTGRLLDLGLIPPKSYTGIDPSKGMLNELVRKYPRLMPGQVHAGYGHEVMPGLQRGYGLVAALFGSGSYLKVSEWEEMVRLSRGLVMIMVYAQGYLPPYYEGEQRAALAEQQDVLQVNLNRFIKRHKAFRKRWRNYDLVMVST